MRDGRAFKLDSATLPEPVRLALARRQLDAAGLAPGAHYDAAHGRLLAAPSAMRAEAERKAAIACVLAAAPTGLSWSARGELVAAQLGTAPPSSRTLKCIMAAMRGVDPINFAPALLAGYTCEPGRQAEVDPDAWSFFLTTLRRAGAGFPIRHAWRDVRDVAVARGWGWPSLPTVQRLWAALPEAERLLVRLGREEAVRRLAQQILRDKASIGPLEWVSLDGRTLDFWVDMGDGRAVRPVMLVLVDVASNAVLGWELSPSENATATVRLIRRVCQARGIFDRLYTDNGSAFAGHLVAGGAGFRFRGGARAGAVRPLGICHHLGIELRFALPRNAQAKIAERAFASLSRVVDDRPEFAGAHAGHAPGAAPDGRVVPVPLDVALAVLAREVERHNREAGRRAQGADGRSYQAVLNAGLAARVRRVPTKRQLYLAGLEWRPASVDCWGRVQVDAWTYGGPETQAALLPFHGKGKINLGRDPEDFDAPALAFDDAGRLICEGIEPVRRGAYGSLDGAREAAKNRKAARAAVAQADAAQVLLTDAEFAARMRDLDAAVARQVGEAPTAPPAGRVVAGTFGGILTARAVTSEPRPVPKPLAPAATVPEEFRRNMDRKLARMRASDEKLA